MLFLTHHTSIARADFLHTGLVSKTISVDAGAGEKKLLVRKIFKFNTPDWDYHESFQFNLPDTLAGHSGKWISAKSL